MSTPKQIARTIIELMEQQGLLDYLPEVLEELEGYVQEEDSGIVVESARELDEESLEMIREMLANKLGYEPSIEMRVNPKLIAGVRLRINDQLIDASVKSQLEQIFEKIH